jgi:dihydroorotase-like cyclic amidohydrolase
MWASMTLVNPCKSWRIKGRELHSKAETTPFEGWDVPMSVEKVFLRGVLAYSEGEFLVDPGFGGLIV